MHLPILATMQSLTAKWMDALLTKNLTPPLSHEGEFMAACEGTAYTTNFILIILFIKPGMSDVSIRVPAGRDLDGLLLVKLSGMR